MGYAQLSNGLWRNLKMRQVGEEHPLLPGQAHGRQVHRGQVSTTGSRTTRGKEAR